jgi:hypothetical protein
MKKELYAFILSTLILLSLNIEATSQIPQGTENEVKTLLCNKWKMTIMESQGITQKIPSDKSVYFFFRKNGVVSLAAAGDSHDEYWTYDHDTKTIIVKENNIAKNNDVFKILKIDDKTLVLNFNSGGMIGTLYFTVTK